jgi:DNA (cytosine-5)-methyltransferase 1
MTAYYNEIDPKAAAWLRELIKQGHIADGVVDERSIIDVTPDELRGFTQCHFFAGIGVWSYALRSAGWADDRPVWTGSCPCQPFSTAGRQGGFDDERHLWPHWHHLISQCQPAIVFGEQVASKDGLGWLDLVSTDLDATGYAFGAADLCAAGIGAPHIRQRLFFGSVRLADTSNAGSQGRLRGRADEGWEDQHGHAGRDCAVGRPSPTNGHWGDADWLYCRDGKWRAVEPSTFPLVNGAAERVGRLRGYGNAIVAQVAQTFIESMMEITA